MSRYVLYWKTKGADESKYDSGVWWASNPWSVGTSSPFKWWTMLSYHVSKFSYGHFFDYKVEKED